MNLEVTVTRDYLSPVLADRSAAYLGMLQQKYLLVQLLALAFYFRLPLSFFLENKKREREAVRVGGCWLQKFEGRKQQQLYTSVETLPEMLGTHTVVTCPFVSGCVVSSSLLLTCLLWAR